jgi:hypothetical protein
MVSGSILGGRTCRACCSPMQNQCFARAVILAVRTCSNASMPVQKSLFRDAASRPPSLRAVHPRGRRSRRGSLPGSAPSFPAESLQAATSTPSIRRAKFGPLRAAGQRMDRRKRSAVSGTELAEQPHSAGSCLLGACALPVTAKSSAGDCPSVPSGRPRILRLGQKRQQRLPGGERRAGNGRPRERRRGAKKTRFFGGVVR